MDRWIRMIATNRLTGHSSGFFSVYTLPPNQAVSPEAQRKINQERGQIPPDRDVKEIILKKTKSLIRDLTHSQRAALMKVAPKAELYCQDARTPILSLAGQVQLVVTSPPFLDVVQYAQDNWLRCWFNGIDAGGIYSKITMSRNLEQWSSIMEGVLLQLHGILKPGGWVAFEVGEVRNGSIRLDEVIAPLGVRAGLTCHGVRYQSARLHENGELLGRV